MYTLFSQSINTLYCLFVLSTFPSIYSLRYIHPRIYITESSVVQYIAHDISIRVYIYRVQCGAIYSPRHIHPRIYTSKKMLLMQQGEYTATKQDFDSFKQNWFINVHCSSCLSSTNQYYCERTEQSRLINVLLISNVVSIYLPIMATPVGDLNICASSCRNISKAKIKKGV